MKIFLEANILFSASWPGSRTGKIMTGLLKRAEVLTSAYAVEETTRNLVRQAPEALDELGRLVSLLQLVAGTTPLADLGLPAKDRPIIAAAVAARCTHLLTGDFKHCGPWFGRSIGGIKVVSMRMLVDEMVGLGWIGEA